MLNVYTKDNIDYRESPEGDYMINPSEDVLRNLDPKKIKNIEINDSMGKVQDPSYLTRFKSIEGLAILMMRNLDLSFVEELENLRHLWMTNDYQQKIDLEWFPKLKTLMLGWNKKITNLGNSTSLEKLGLWKYKASDLSELSNMGKLKELTLVQSSMVSLEGLNSKAPMESIKLVSCRNLNSIRGIEKFSKLRVIDWDGCAVPDIEPLRQTTGLESLGIHNGKKIKSLSPLKNLKKLQIIYITGNTEIIDSDMTPLIGRKDAFIRPHKHYSHSHIEIDKLNGTVRPGKDSFEL